MIDLAMYMLDHSALMYAIFAFGMLAAGVAAVVYLLVQDAVLTRLGIMAIGLMGWFTLCELAAQATAHLGGSARVGTGLFALVLLAVVYFIAARMPIRMAEPQP